MVRRRGVDPRLDALGRAVAGIALRIDAPAIAILIVRRPGHDIAAVDRRHGSILLGVRRGGIDNGITRERNRVANAGHADHRRVRHRRDVDADGALVRAGSIVERVGERRLAREVRVRCEGDDAGIERHRTVDRTRDAGDRQRLRSGRIAVIADEIRHRETERGVFVGLCGIVHRCRPFRHVCDRDRDILRIDTSGTIGHLHLHIVHVVSARIGDEFEIGRVGKAERAGGAVDPEQCGVRPPGDGITCRTAVNIRRGYGCNRRAVLCNGHRSRRCAAIRRDHRRVVGAGNGDGDGLGNRIAVAVLHGEGDLHQHGFSRRQSIECGPRRDADIIAGCRLDQGNAGCARHHAHRQVGIGRRSKSNGRIVGAGYVGLAGFDGGAVPFNKRDQGGRVLFHCRGDVHRIGRIVIDRDGERVHSGFTGAVLCSHGEVERHAVAVAGTYMIEIAAKFERVRHLEAAGTVGNNLDLKNEYGLTGPEVDGFEPL